MGQGQLGRVPQLLFGVRRRPCDQLDHRQDGVVVQRHPEHSLLKESG